MRIGVIGSGNIGGTVATLLARAGHEVQIANSRGPESLRGLAAERLTPATIEAAAEHGEVVVVATPLAAYAALPAQALASSRRSTRCSGRFCATRATRRPATNGSSCSSRATTRAPRRPSGV